MRALAAVSVLTALSLAGCATLPDGHRCGGDATIAPGWARVEGGWHYPSDTLAGMAIGNFCAEFFTDAFMGLDATREHLGFSSLPGGGAISFAVALGEGS